MELWKAETSPDMQKLTKFIIKNPHYNKRERLKGEDARWKYWLIQCKERLCSSIKLLLRAWKISPVSSEQQGLIQMSPFSRCITSEQTEHRDLGKTQGLHKFTTLRLGLTTPTRALLDEAYYIFLCLDWLLRRFPRSECTVYCWEMGNATQMLESVTEEAVSTGCFNRHNETSPLSRRN